MIEIMDQDNAIVAFTALWCGPCKTLKPQFAKAAVIDKDVSYYVVDVDEVGMDYLQSYGIQSIPQIFKMNKGKIVKPILSRTAEGIISEKMAS